MNKNKMNGVDVLLGVFNIRQRFEVSTYKDKTIYMQTQLKIAMRDFEFNKFMHDS